MVVTTRPFPTQKVVPFSASKSAAPRSFDVIHAELRAEHERHAATVERLAGELAGISADRTGTLRGARSGEPQQSKKDAARALGISEARLSRLIAKYHRDYPDQPRLAVQAAGYKNGRWTVYTERVRNVMESGEPY